MLVYLVLHHNSFDEKNVIAAFTQKKNAENCKETYDINAENFTGDNSYHVQTIETCD